MPQALFSENETMYDSIDEVIALPPSRLIRYGNTVFLIIIIMLITLFCTIDYTNGRNFTATIPPAEATRLSSGKSESIVLSIREAHRSTVKRGDVLVTVLPKGQTHPDTIRALVSGKIIATRKLQVNDRLEAETPLYIINSGDTRHKAQIYFSNTDIEPVYIGQEVRLTGLFGQKATNWSAEIISLPYRSKNNGSFIADAYITSKINEDMMPPTSDIKVNAFVVDGKKKLIFKLF